MTRAAIFIDKDGTLIEDVPFNVDPQKIRLSTGANVGLRRLARAGYALVVITNQPGIAQGRFDEMALQKSFDTLHALLIDAGIELDGIYYCPHDRTGRVSAFARSCDCRKPAPGLILRAAQELDIDLAQSWFIGDILHDIEAGNRAGCRTVLLDNGNETEWQRGPWRTPFYVARNLADAAELIMTAEPVYAPPGQRRQGRA